MPNYEIDTTMLFAPRSGGVKRYLLAKRAWLARWSEMAGGVDSLIGKFKSKN